MDDVDAGFYLLRPPPDGDLPPEGPTGVDDLLGHFSIRKIHDAVAAREAANYLKSAPCHPLKTGLYRAAAHSLTRLAVRSHKKADVKPFPVDFLRRSLALPTGRHELGEEGKGEPVEMDPSMGGPPDTPPGGAEGSTAKDSDRSKTFETKIKFVVAGRVDKVRDRRDKKAKREKKEKKRKERSKDRERSKG